MSLDINGQKCVVCSAYLFSEDDVVYCPVCGAPHHRDCYNSIGHCGAEDTHGTEKQYKRIEIKETKEENKPFGEALPCCRRCGKAAEEGAKFCPHCGLPFEEIPPFADFGPFGKVVEIKDDEQIDEGVTALDAAKTVIVNPLRYIPKFLQLKGGRKKSWNWAAFLLPHAWFAYRKMYLPAAVSGIFILISELFSLPLSASLALLPMPEQQLSYMEYAMYLTENMASIDTLALLLATVGLAIGVAVRIISGIYGDFIYKNSVVGAVRKIRDSEDKPELAKKLSGTSFFGFMIAFFGETLLMDLISILIL